MMRLKKKTIIGYTQTVSKNILERMRTVRRTNRGISVQELVQSVALSTFREDSFATSKDWQEVLETLVFRCVQSRLAIDGHLEWIHERQGWKLFTKTYIEYFNSSGFRVKET
jgi:hypothetical protein